MNAIDLSILNLKETRRRSIILWRSLPDSWIDWRPDKEALSFGEMIRHVWSASFYYHMVLKNSGSVKTETPRSIKNLSNLLKKRLNYRNRILKILYHMFNPLQPRS